MNSKNELTSIQKKLLCIQKINEERTRTQENTYEVEYLNLKAKFEDEYSKLHEQIMGIVKGTTSISDFNISEEEYAKYKIEKSSTSDEAGIPGYFKKALINSALSYYEINENDEKILDHLSEIRIVPLSDKISFTLEFIFSENEFFTNSTLQKTFTFSTKDHMLHKVTSIPINWKYESVIPNKIKKIKTIIKSNQCCLIII